MNYNSHKKGFISLFFWTTLNFFSRYYFPKNITNFILISSKNTKKIKMNKIDFFMVIFQTAYKS